MQILTDLSILIVDDDPATRGYMAALLRGQGCNIFEAGDGREALSVLSERVPDFVCLDLMLPEMSGFQVCEALRKDARTHSVPILVVSARTGVDDRAYAIEVGADGFLEKPFRRREFLASVEGLIVGKGSRVEVS